MDPRGLSQNPSLKNRLEKKRSDVRTKHPRGHVSTALCRRIDGSAVKVRNPLNIVWKLTVSVICTHNIQPYLHQSAPILKCHVINLLCGTC